MSANTLIATVSFEERCTHWVREFVDSGGNLANVFVADVYEHGEKYAKNMREMRKLGVENMDHVDRLSSESLWRWVVKTSERASAISGDLTIDATCMPRELLGMLLFSVSVRRRSFRRILITYVSAPEGGYATQNKKLSHGERWLSKGVASVRSIVGYPGVFHSEQRCHLVVFAGHELERTLRLAEYIEPYRLTISGELEQSSTVPGAREISQSVADKLKRKMQVPEIGDIGFSSSSIDEVYKNLMKADLGASGENVALVAMNTKLSFVGAALFALSNRAVRMMYAVPREYNELYCEGIGKASQFDITEMMNKAST